MSVHFSSDKMDWATPQGFFDRLDDEFDFIFDPCTDGTNSKCPIFSVDSLNQDWAKYRSVFMNPPYGRVIGQWMKKAYEESQKGCTVVCLVPSRTDTKWWHDYAMKADEIRLVKGRITFEGAPSVAPFPSAVVIFRPVGYKTRFSVMEAKS